MKQSIKKVHSEIDDAIKCVCDNMFVKNKGDRSDAQNYLVLLSTSKSNSGADPVKVQAAACKTKGIRIATVGIGSNTDEDLLKEVAYSMPNYYLSTDYDELPETLPNLVIQMMDYSTDFVSNFDYTDYLNHDVITERIEETGKKVVKRAWKKDFLQSTGPCVRPDKMKSPKLKEELEERGLSTTGSNEDLISRLQTDDRSCEILNTTLSLPKITNSWLKDRLYYSISNDCLHLNVCIDVSFEIGSFNYSKAFNAFLVADFCKFVLTYGIESVEKSIILINYKWGKLEMLTITKNFQVLLIIDKDTDKKVFKLDFGLRICFEGDCVIDEMYLEDHEIPIPICNENFTFLDCPVTINPQKYLPASIRTMLTYCPVTINPQKYLPASIRTMLTYCPVTINPQKYLPASIRTMLTYCPVTINPQKYLPASIRTMLQCEMTDNCFGLDCCIDLTFKLPLGDKECDLPHTILTVKLHCQRILYLFLDESGNVNQDVFTVSLEAISEATGKLAIGENLIHVGMSMFGGTGTSRTSFDLDTSFERKTVLQSIRETSFNKKENTDIGDALRYVCENMFVSVRVTEEM
ncbi:unnamed protein product [Mytilus edulis]|uniref:VWFA domain-containing protein n=1 Tax=Mytilus edulis TaxID=6550 RepID=A0A8S3QRQ5_MYTED|nr:unnamed protein product [Mytilus edulis]